MTSLCALAGTASAQERGLSLTARVGGSYNAINRPVDPVGEPTLLYGTAFTGGGFALGAGVDYLLSEALGEISLGAELFYSRSTGTGYAETVDRARRQELTLGAHQLRVPISLRIATKRDEPEGFTLRFGLGPELLLGLASDASLTSTGVSNPPAAPATVPTTHVALNAQLGAAWYTPTYAIPFEVRLSLNPMAQDSTRTRFDNYQGPANPGSFQVAFDWQLLFLVGFEYQIK
jgi:hypothetical protein